RRPPQSPLFPYTTLFRSPFMDAIDIGFAWLASNTAELLPVGPINGLITDGIIAGIGGIVIFIPQIAILFIFISIMEESGYMSRRSEEHTSELQSRENLVC